MICYLRFQWSVLYINNLRLDIVDYYDLYGIQSSICLFLNSNG